MLTALTHPKLVFLLWICTVSPALAQRPVRVASPNNRIVFSLTTTKSLPTYRVTFDKTVLIDDSPLSLEFLEGGAFGAGIGAGQVDRFPLLAAPPDTPVAP